MTSRFFITCLLAGVAFVGAPLGAHAQIASWTFTTIDYNQTGPLAATVVDPNTTASTLAAVGLSQNGIGNPNASYYDTPGNGQTYGLLVGDEENSGNEISIPTTIASAESNNDYIGFSVTPNAGYALTLNTLSFYASDELEPGSVQIQYELGSSWVNGAGIDVGTPTTITNSSVNGLTQLITEDLTGISDLTGDTNTVQFAMFFANPNGHSGDEDSLGSTSAYNVVPTTPGLELDGLEMSDVPEPSTWGLFLVAIPVMAFWAYRRKQQT